MASAWSRRRRILGSHLCDRLIERGDDVICVDNFFTGSKSNIRHLIGHHDLN